MGRVNTQENGVKEAEKEEAQRKERETETINYTFFQRCLHLYNFEMPV